jgi:hypothetical protein
LGSNAQQHIKSHAQALDLISVFAAMLAQVNALL